MIRTTARNLIQKLFSIAQDGTHIDEGHHRGRKLLALWEAEGECLLTLQKEHGDKSNCSFPFFVQKISNSVHPSLLYQAPICVLVFKATGGT